MQSTEMRFASFLSGGFTTMAVIASPERKLAKRTSVQRCVFYLTQIPDFCELQRIFILIIKHISRLSKISEDRVKSRETICNVVSLKEKYNINNIDPMKTKNIVHGILGHISNNTDSLSMLV